MFPYGVVYQSAVSGGNDNVTYVPLEELRVRVLIVDSTARVTLTQVYSNSLYVPTRRCKYLFPVPASAAICAFDMRSDDQVITGLVKEKDQAREEYEEALKAGRLAGLVNYVTDDIFTMSIGIIPAHTTIETRLVYVMTLVNDDNLDEVRFQLPMGVGVRYGVPPTDLDNASAPTPHTRIKITTEVQMSGRIQHITSPSHHGHITITGYPTHQGRISNRRSTIRYRSRTYLDRDFVLVILSDGLDSPRCFAEIQEDSQGQDICTIAMQLSLVPKNALSSHPINGQEYLLVIDRSGSMSGGRIQQAKKTVNLLLRMLPAQGTVFNIFIFDSSVSSLWPRSHDYNQDSLSQATAYVDSIEVEGGTEIGEALRYVLDSRNRTMPTGAFVLTDGEVHNMQALKAISFVESSVKNASQGAPLRVFTLGIGSGISTATCEGIAKAGNGICLFALDAEHILGKCVRLFAAGRTPFVRNVTVDWGIPDEYLSSSDAVVTFPTQASSRVVAIWPAPVIQQVPTQIHEIHAGTRMNISVIIRLRKNYVPRNVTLRGEWEGSGELFNLITPIRGVQLVDSEPDLPPVHILAAWRIIQNHQEQRAPLPKPVNPTSSEDELRKAAIVQLGEKYQLVSRYTSFVAMHSDPDGRRPVYNRTTRPNSEQHREHSGRKSANTLWSVIRNVYSVFQFGMREVNHGRNQVPPGAWPERDSSEPSLASDDEDGDVQGYTSEQTFSTLSSLESYETSNWSISSSPHVHLITQEVEGQHSPKLESRNLAPDTEPPSQNAPPVQPLAPPPVPSEIIDLFQLQSFDGSFPLDQSLGRIVGMNGVEEVNNLRVEDRVWATALSVALVRKQMGSRKEVLHDLLVKAMDFLRTRSYLDVEEVIREASKFV